jgi:divalent metal cation (Fe/Co/Zn/Cd) transporter
MSSEKTAIKATYFSIIGNFLWLLLKALLDFLKFLCFDCDAIESTADIFASFFSAIWYKIFNRPADENHPYGHGRAEV